MTPWEPPAQAFQKSWEPPSEAFKSSPKPGAAEHTEAYLKANAPKDADGGFWSSLWQAGGQPLVDAVKKKYEGLTTNPLGEITTAVQQAADPGGTLLAMGKGAVEDLGETAATVKRQYDQGNYRGALGTIAGTAGPLLLPELGEVKVPAVAKNTAAAVKVGAKAIAPELVAGGAKVATGAALDAVGLPYHVGTLLGLQRGGPQIVQGAINAARTAREEFIARQAARNGNAEVLTQPGPVNYTPRPATPAQTPGPSTSTGRPLTADEIAFANAQRGPVVSEIPYDEAGAPLPAHEPSRTPVWKDPALAKRADFPAGPPDRTVPPVPRARPTPGTPVAAPVEAKVIPFSKESPTEEAFQQIQRGKRAPVVEKIAQAFVENGLDEAGLSGVLSDVNKAAQLRSMAKAIGAGELPKDLTATVRDLQAKVSEIKSANKPKLVEPTISISQTNLERLKKNPKAFQAAMDLMKEMEGTQ